MPRKKADPGDELYDQLSNLKRLDGYTKQDMYRDFRRVFMGSDEGKRVLHEILAEGRMFHPSAVGSPVDIHHTMINEGKRAVARWLLHTIFVEPAVDQPTQTTRKS